MSFADSELFIGSSGWNYKSWKNDFFQGVVQKKWLEHYSSKFNAVEVNATFYRLLKENVLQGWKDRTPDEFYFAIKGSRYTTHTKRLKDPRESIQKQQENLSPLRDRIKAVLWQLPGSMQKDPERLEGFLQALQTWPEHRHAIEFRHTSWFDSETAGLLQEYNCANCISDAADWPMWDQVTSDLAYVRLHGNTETYVSSYTEQELQKWAERIQSWLQQGKCVHVYFDNTDGTAAPRNALRLKELLGA